MINIYMQNCVCDVLMEVDIISPSENNIGATLHSVMNTIENVKNQI